MGPQGTRTRRWAAAAAIVAVAGARGASAPQASGGASPRLAGQVFGNVQVLRDLPADQMMATMQFIRASLGVRCEFCHVAENGKYRLEDKPEKQRAREMILMTRRLNETMYNGRPVVTCATCHQGAVVPASVPPIVASAINTTRRDPGEPPPPALPTASDLIDRHNALTRIADLPAIRVALEGCHARVMAEGTPAARVIPRGECRTGDVVIDGDRAVTTSALPDGQKIRVGSDGARAWTVGPSGLQWIPDSDFSTFQRKLNPLLVVRVQSSDFASVDVVRRAVLNGRDHVVIEARALDGLRQDLWFDARTGLMSRRTYYHALPLGLDPEQYDLDGYRRLGGATLPSRITTSYLDDQHLGVRKTLLDVTRLAERPTDRDFQPPGGR